MLEYKFAKPFFETGDYPQTIINSTTGAVETLKDPWVDPETGLPKESAKGRWAAPFDEGVWIALVCFCLMGSLSFWSLQSFI